MFDMAIMTGQAQFLELSLIIRDPEIQPRETMNQDTIVQYAEDMAAGIEFPAVVVYQDRKRDQYWLSQGFHRTAAAEAADFEVIFAEVREGSREDAMWDASGSNREHDKSGLRRSNEDKRRAVRMALLARPKAPGNQIAGHLGVAHSFVDKIRKELVSCLGDKMNPTAREVTRNGTTYTMQTGNIGQREASAETDEEEKEDDTDNNDEDVHWTDDDTSDEQAEDEVEVAEPPREADEPADLFQLTPQSISTEVKPASRPTFNATNEMVDWARWTWNPVTGCEHNCVYCYARDIANRFYPEKFTPTFRPERLEAPRFTARPAAAEAETDPVQAMSWRNVFVCSMADLFGRWVPDEWIEDVFASCRKSSQWNYLFLTKFPQRYVGLDFPETAWVGTSVDEQKRVANAEKAFARIKAPVRWLSVEPMRERIVFGDLSMFDWVVIGGQSRSSGAPEFHPEPRWVFDLAYKAWKAGCKVYLKPNTFRDMGWQIKEYPYAGM
jgi:protein gp37